MKFKVNDLVEVIDKDIIYNGSNLNYVFPKVTSTNGENVIVELDGGHYTFHENELILYKRDCKERMI